MGMKRMEEISAILEDKIGGMKSVNNRCSIYGDYNDIIRFRYVRDAENLTESDIFDEAYDTFNELIRENGEDDFEIDITTPLNKYDGTMEVMGSIYFGKVWGREENVEIPDEVCNGEDNSVNSGKRIFTISFNGKTYYAVEFDGSCVSDDDIHLDKIVLAEKSLDDEICKGMDDIDDNDCCWADDEIFGFAPTDLILYGSYTDLSNYAQSLL